MSVYERLTLGTRVYVRGLYLAWLLHAWPLQRILARVERADRLGVAGPRPVRPEDLAALVELIVRRWTFPFTSRCMVQSLLLFALLHPDVPGIRLVIGLRTDGASRRDVVGHAWVTVGDRPLLERDRLAPSTFHSIVTLSGSADAS